MLWLFANNFTLFVQFWELVVFINLLGFFFLFFWRIASWNWSYDRFRSFTVKSWNFSLFNRCSKYTLERFSLFLSHFFSQKKHAIILNASLDIFWCLNSDHLPLIIRNVKLPIASLGFFIFSTFCQVNLTKTLAYVLLNCLISIVNPVFIEALNHAIFRLKILLL